MSRAVERCRAVVRAYDAEFGAGAAHREIACGLGLLAVLGWLAAGLVIVSAALLGGAL